MKDVLEFNKSMLNIDDSIAALAYPDGCVFITKVM